MPPGKSALIDRVYYLPIFGR